MSAGDAREGIIRGKAARARLGGKLVGLSLPRQIAVIAFWPFLEQLLSFFVTSSDLFIATKIGVDAQDTINISDGMGAVVFIMWFGFVIQGSIMMGATAIVSRMTGARDYPQAQHGLHQAAMLGLLAGTISCGLLFTCSDFMVTHVLTMNETARAYALQYVYMAAFAAPFSGVVFAINAALRGSGDTRLPFWIMMSVGILNVIFSVIFVFADAPLGGWRIGGIAAGTVCGYGISMCILLFIMLRRRKKIFTGRKNESLEELVRERGEHYAPPLYLSFSHLRPDMGMQKRILKTGCRRPWKSSACGASRCSAFPSSVNCLLKACWASTILPSALNRSASCPASPSAWPLPRSWGNTWAPGTRLWPASPSGNACGTPSSS